MINSLTKTIDGLEYVNVKELEIEENNYTIYIDMKTKEKVRIYDENNKLEKNTKIIEKILKNNFSKYTNIKYETTFSVYESIKKEIQIMKNVQTFPDGRIQYSNEEKEELLNKVKTIFFEKFGQLLPEKYYNLLIKKNISDIYEAKTIRINLSGDTQIVGIYDNEAKELTILGGLTDNKKIISAFHESIHALVGGKGATKKIDLNGYFENQNYEYGDAIDEGIVSYIENMKNSKELPIFTQTGSYDENRRIVSQLRIIYDNIKMEKEDNFIEQYILDSKNTLFRIYNIFENHYTQLFPNLTEKEIELVATNKFFKFISLTENLGKQPESLSECERKLFEIYKNQILNKKIKTEDELNKLIEEMKIYNTNLLTYNTKIYDLIEKKKKEFYKNNNLDER